MDILTPFRYCQYKELDADRVVIECVTLAGHLMAGMPMCEKHAKLVEAGLGEITLVRAADKGDGIGQEKVDYKPEKLITEPEEPEE